MRTLFVLGIISIIILSSCKKDEEITDNTPTTTADYTPLTIGNYWIYENYMIDSTGNESLQSQIDTVIVDRDTIINGNTYFILMGTRYSSINNWGIVDIVRDSGNYLVNNEGEILFSSSNFTDTLGIDTTMYGNDTLVYIIYQMENIIGDVNLSGEIFSNVLNLKGTVYSPIYSYLPGFPKYVYNYYAPGVGKIYTRRTYLISDYKIEQRLIEYHIQ